MIVSDDSVGMLEFLQRVVAFLGDNLKTSFKFVREVLCSKEIEI